MVAPLNAHSGAKLSGHAPVHCTMVELTAAKVNKGTTLLLFGQGLKSYNLTLHKWNLTP